jgi:Rrf2 family transcriptional regulator, iron-sulfur cluster assembly transcription factor
MKVSAQEEYGLRCLLHMAKCGDTESLSIPEISRAEGLSIPNVAKLMRLLRLSGFVESARGQAGGYTLSRPADQITVSEVLEALGGRFYGPSFCERHAGIEKACNHNVDCSIRALWSSMQNAMENLLGKTTLRDLIVPENQMLHWISDRPATFAKVAAAGSESMVHQ